MVETVPQEDLFRIFSVKFMPFGRQIRRKDHDPGAESRWNKIQDIVQFSSRPSKVQIFVILIPDH